MSLVTRRVDGYSHGVQRRIQSLLRFTQQSIQLRYNLQAVSTTNTQEKKEKSQKEGNGNLHTRLCALGEYNDLHPYWFHHKVEHTEKKANSPRRSQQCHGKKQHRNKLMQTTDG